MVSVPEWSDEEIWAHLVAQERQSPDESAEHRAHVEKEAERLRVRREAAQLVDQESAARDFVIPPSTATLADELKVKDPPLTYTVDELHPRGGNTLLGAQFKAGKTTMLANLLRSLTDERVFLGNHATRRAPGRVAFWNYEVDGRQFRQWLRTIDHGPHSGCQWKL